MVNISAGTGTELDDVHAVHHGHGRLQQRHLPKQRHPLNELQDGGGRAHMRSEWRLDWPVQCPDRVVLD